MPLFEIPKRTNNRANDKAILKQAKVVNKATPTIKGGGSLFERIANIQKLVELHLGKYKDLFTLIQDEEHLRKYIDKCIKNGVISIDTETTGLDPMLDDIAGICIYTPGEKSAYIPINHVSYITNLKLDNQLSIEYIRKQVERIIDASIDVIMYNAKFDIRVLRNKVGLHNIYCTWDCYLATRLLNENEPVNALKKIHQKYVLNGKADAFTFDELFKGIPFTLIPIKTAYLYAANDPKITYELYEYQRKYLREDSDREDMRAIYWTFKNIEMPCIDATAVMEDNGVLIDMEFQKKLSVKYHKLLQERLDDFNREVAKYEKDLLAYKHKNPTVKLDIPINVKSPQQLAILFYDILDIGVVDKRKPRGTGEEVLSKLDNPVAKAIQNYRGVQKLVDTYIDKLPDCINTNDGRIHASFNQYGTVTGRFSSDNPNLQNIPSHGESKEIRKMFVASPGYVLMSSDYSQQEPKCLAALCRKQGDPQMYNTFMQGKDLYSEIASKAFNQPYEMCLEHFPKGTKIKYVRQKKKWYYGRDDDYDKIADGETDTYDDGKERRTQAKSILLGVLYGRGEASIAEQLGCTIEKAQAIKSSVFKGFPAIKQFEQDSMDMAYDLGYVTTISGRKRRLPDLQLDEYEFQWKNGVAPDSDVLDFDSEEEQEIPQRTIRKYLTQLHKARFNEKRKIFEKANDAGVWIVDNGAKIAEASRQVVNSRIQGSAADLTKLAMIELNKNERLKELGFRLLIQIHDEVIVECPEENAKECSKILADTMSKAAEGLLKMPIKCDVTMTREWYGEEVAYE